MTLQYLKPLTETPQIRLGIQGFPNTGKTWAAMTFPKPRVVNLDRGLGAHVGRQDAMELPFWDVAWVRSTFKKPSYNRNELKDVLVGWIEGDAQQLASDETLILDGNTGLQNAYHSWYEANKMRFLTKSGQVDDFAEWQNKKKYFGQIMEALKTLKCHVVYICHEADQRDKVPVGTPVTYSGKIKPLLSGGFADEIGSHFTDWFRAQVNTVPADFKSLNESTVKADWGMTLAEYEKFCRSSTNGSIYYWQTVGDNVFDAKASSLVNAPRFIPAHYESFKKFQRK